MRKALWSAVLLIVFASCSAARKPELHLADMRVGEMRPFETELVMAVRVENGDTRPLRLVGAAYRLYINDVYVGKGLSSEALTIPPLSSALQSATLQLSNLALLPTIQRLISSQDFSYRIEGTLYRSGLFGDVHVAQVGRFALPQ